MNKRQPTADGSTRRDFAKAMALLAATPVVVAFNPVQAHQTASVETPTTAVDSLTEIVRLRYGKHLTEDQLKEVKKSIERNQRSADILRRSKLSNSDEPAFTFRADLP